MGIRTSGRVTPGRGRSPCPSLFSRTSGGLTRVGDLKPDPLRQAFEPELSKRTGEEETAQAADPNGPRVASTLINPKYASPAAETSADPLADKREEDWI